MMYLRSSAIRTPLGDGATTFRSLMAGESAAQRDERRGENVGTRWGYPCAREIESLLRDCLREAVADVTTVPTGVKVIVGTGLRALHQLEQPTTGKWQLNNWERTVHEVLPSAEVMVISNACSAGGFALAAAEDLMAAHAPMVIVCAADTSTASMLAMIARGSAEETQQVRPFDTDRPGILLGDAAAAVVLTRDKAPGSTRILTTGLSCDAFHETAPDPHGIHRAIDDAYTRASRDITDADLIVAHGTGTALNDPAEAEAIARQLSHRPSPPITALKGALGHSSGAAALINLVVADHSIGAGVIPPIVGLREPLADPPLDYVRAPRTQSTRLVQINAFGFGGVNAVTLLEAA